MWLLFTNRLEKYSYLCITKQGENNHLLTTSQQMSNQTKPRTFVRPSTCELVKTANKAEIKMMKACGWREIKPVKKYDVWGREIAD
jgi:hypothetical protein